MSCPPRSSSNRRKKARSTGCSELFDCENKLVLTGTTVSGTAFYFAAAFFQIGHLVIAGLFELIEHIFKGGTLIPTRIPLIAADLLRIERALIFIASVVVKVSGAASLTCAATCRSILVLTWFFRLCFFDGKADFAFLCDVDDLHLHDLVLFEVLRNVLNISSGHLRDVHHAGLALRQLYKSSEFGDAGYFAFQYVSNF